MDAKFYNKMPFQIPLRKVWEEGAKAILLNPGEILIGPVEILCQFQFLAQVPMDFSRVESTIQSNNGGTYEYKDNLINQNFNVKTSSIKQTKINNEVVNPVQETSIQETVEDVSTEPITGLDFNPKEVNWVTVKVDQLERACKFLKINIDYLNDKKPKQKKWELVKLVKDYYKI